MSTVSVALAEESLAPIKEVNKVRTSKSRERSADDLLQEIEATMGESWLPNIYARILKLRTRSYDFPSLARNSAPEIQHTLLGIELKAAFATRVRTMLIGKVRDGIAAAGAGTRIPEFKQSTKQARR